MAGQGFHHVAIRAIDFDETLKFYTEGLGCSVRFEFSVPGRIDRAVFLDRYRDRASLALGRFCARPAHA